MPNFLRRAWFCQECSLPESSEVRTNRISGSSIAAADFFGALKMLFARKRTLSLQLRTCPDFAAVRRSEESEIVSRLSVLKRREALKMSAPKAMSKVVAIRIKNLAPMENRIEGRSFLVVEGRASGTISILSQC